jgi:hypothetical protein
LFISFFLFVASFGVFLFIPRWRLTVLIADPNTPVISEQMVRAVEHYPIETIVLVKAKIRRPPQKVKNATIHDAELDIQEIHRVTQLTEHVPFTVYDAENITRNVDGDDSSDDEGPDAKSPISSPRSSQDISRSSRTSQDVIRSGSRSGRVSLDVSRSGRPSQDIPRSAHRNQDLMSPVRKCKLSIASCY